MRIPRVGKFKELAQNHRLWKYELKFSCIYHQGTDIPYTPAYPEKLNCDPEKNHNLLKSSVYGIHHAILLCDQISETYGLKEKGPLSSQQHPLVFYEEKQCCVTEGNVSLWITDDSNGFRRSWILWNLPCNPIVSLNSSVTE